MSVCESNRPQSEAVFAASQKVLPGGVNSPVRAFGSVGGTPVVFRSGKGARVTDVDGKSYIDYVGSWGPLILGHCPPSVVAAAKATVETGSSFGAPTEVELELAQEVRNRVPSVEMVRMVNSGTEACMAAIRLARGYTGRDKIVKFEGHYHGHADCLLVAAGSGMATLGIPGSPGVPEGAVRDTLTLAWNDVEGLKQVFAEHSDSIAAVLFEPVTGNMGVIPPEEAFLKALVEVPKAHGALLICDEVMTGFRLSRGGAQTRLGIEPDLSCFGKVLGGGYPVGAYGGRAEIMEHLAPLGPVYQAGTLSGNPVAMAAGLATLAGLDDAAYQGLEERSRELVEGFDSVHQKLGVPVSTRRVGSMFTVFFRETPPRNFAEAKEADIPRFQRFFHAMLDRGVYLAPSAFEAGFVSTAHLQPEIQETLEAHEAALTQAFAESDA